MVSDRKADGETDGRMRERKGTLRYMDNIYIAGSSPPMGPDLRTTEGFHYNPGKHVQIQRRAT